MEAWRNISERAVGKVKEIGTGERTFRAAERGDSLMGSKGLITSALKSGHCTR